MNERLLQTSREQLSANAGLVACTLALGAVFGYAAASRVAEATPNTPLLNPESASVIDYTTVDGYRQVLQLLDNHRAVISKVETTKVDESFTTQLKHSLFGMTSLVTGKNVEGDLTTALPIGYTEWYSEPGACVAGELQMNIHFTEPDGSPTQVSAHTDVSCG